MIGRYTAKPGQLDAGRRYLAGHAQVVENSNGRIVLFGTFVDESDEVRIVQVHPDAASFAEHLRLGWESGHFEKANEFLADGRWDLYGDPGPELEAQLTDPSVGVPITVHHAAHGFERLATPGSTV